MSRLLVWWLHSRHIRFQERLAEQGGVELVGGSWDGHIVREPVVFLEFPSRPDCLCSGRWLACYAWDGNVMRFAGWLRNPEADCQQGASGKRGEA